MAVYMKLGSAVGDVTEAGHKNWIEVLSVSWSTSRRVRSAVGVGKNRESTSAYVSEILIEKLIDSASSNIAQSAFVGQEEPCIIDFTRVDKGQEAILRKVVLMDAIMSSLTTQGTKDGRPTETLTLNFTHITITDIDEAATGASAGTSTVIYDLQLAQTG